ncbi:hypothetical protein ACIQPR_46205 [Streptomyces sp. NPDC091280]|uniref:hypothetical protein n=1 Tax=Streptomyces sp. NPDC091280 TaxID=3365984 RepID=UPI003823A998
MSTRRRPSSVDARLQQVFDAAVDDLYEMVVLPDASPALTRALELRSFLALAEEQVARVRDRVHDATAVGRDMGELSPDALRLDAEWLKAALDARAGYRAAVDTLLRAMPPAGPRARPVRTAQPPVTTALPTAVAAPAPQSAGAARAR